MEKKEGGLTLGVGTKGESDDDGDDGN